MTTFICDRCKGRNLTQQLSIMVPPETTKQEMLEFIDHNWDSLLMEDYFWCDDCGDECHVEEIDES